MADKEKADEKKAGVLARIGDAFARVLDHAESHGEVYVGAKDDHATLRAAVEDGHIPEKSDA